MTTRRSFVYTPKEGPTPVGPNFLGAKRTNETGVPDFVLWRFSSDMNDMLLGEEDFISGETPEIVLQELRDRNPAPGNGIERVWFCSHGICVSEIPLADEAVVDHQYLYGSYAYLWSTGVIKADAVDTLRAATALGDPVLLESSFASKLREHHAFEDSGLIISSVNSISTRNGERYLRVRSDIKKSEALKKTRETKERKAKAKNDRMSAFLHFQKRVREVVGEISADVSARLAGYDAGEKYDTHWYQNVVARGRLRVGVSITDNGSADGTLVGLLEMMALEKRLPGKKMNWKSIPSLFGVVRDYGDLPPKPWTDEENTQALIKSEDVVKFLAGYQATIAREFHIPKRKSSVRTRMEWNPGDPAAPPANATRNGKADEVMILGPLDDPECLIVEASSRYHRYALVRIASYGSVRRMFYFQCDQYQDDIAQSALFAFDNLADSSHNPKVCDIMVKPWYVAKCYSVNYKDTPRWVREEVKRILNRLPEFGTKQQEDA